MRGNAVAVEYVLTHLYVRLVHAVGSIRIAGKTAVRVRVAGWSHAWGIWDTCRADSAASDLRSVTGD